MIPILLFWKDWACFGSLWNLNFQHLKSKFNTESWPAIELLLCKSPKQYWSIFWKPGMWGIIYGFNHTILRNPMPMIIPTKSFLNDNHTDNTPILEEIEDIKNNCFTCIQQRPLPPLLPLAQKGFSYQTQIFLLPAKSLWNINYLSVNNYENFMHKDTYRFPWGNPNFQELEVNMITSSNNILLHPRKS